MTLGDKLEFKVMLDLVVNMSNLRDQLRCPIHSPELSTRFGINKIMPKEQELDFIQSPVNLKE